MLNVQVISKLAILIAIVMSAGGAAPATSPSGSSPTTNPSTPLRTWFDQLADADPDVREQARVSLMGMSRAQLAELRAIVRDSRPLRPSQASELHDIVTQVYLATEPYQAVAGTPFLGLQWATADAAVWTDPPGLVVDRRFKGFAAYRFLKDGDIIVGIGGLRDVVFDGTATFAAAISEFQPGDTINLKVLRNGQVVRVPVKLSRRPVAPATDISPFQNPRETKAEDYWEENFAKLVGEPVTAARN